MLARMEASMQARMDALESHVQARLADLERRVVEARAPAPIVEGVLQPSPTRIAPQPAQVAQPTLPLHATALRSPLRSPAAAPAGLQLARGGRASAYLASPASDQGPSFSTLGSFENLLLFGQGLFPGYIGRDFGSRWPAAGAAVRSKLRQVYAYLQPLDSTALGFFCAAYPGKRGVANFTAAYKFVAGLRQ